MIDLIARYWPALLDGLRVTVTVAGIVSLAGLVVGGVVGVLAGSLGRVLVAGVRLANLVIAAVPLLVILLWFHYPVQMAFSVVVDPLYTLIAVLGVVNAVLVADAVSRVVQDLPSEWSIVAHVNGLSRYETLTQIVAPLAMRQLVGPLLTIQIGMLQATIFGSLISVNELFRVVQRIDAIEFDPVRVYSLLALFFLLICAPLHWLAGVIRRRVALDLSMR